MMNQFLEELAGLYGIEINDVEPNEGGLFYVDYVGNKVLMTDIFEADEYLAPRNESVSLQSCVTYSTYTEMAFLMPDAA